MAAAYQKMKKALTDFSYYDVHPHTGYRIGKAKGRVWTPAFDNPEWRACKVKSCVLDDNSMTKERDNNTTMQRIGSRFSHGPTNERREGCIARVMPSRYIADRHSGLVLYCHNYLSTENCGLTAHDHIRLHDCWYWCPHHLDADGYPHVEAVDALASHVPRPKQ
jgi:hypothetical protein